MNNFGELYEINRTNPKLSTFLDLSFIILLILGIIVLIIPLCHSLSSYLEALSVEVGVAFILSSIAYLMIRGVLLDETYPRLKTFFGTDDRIFTNAQHCLKIMLNKHDRVKLRIYAPFGVWYEGNNGKDDWLKLIKRKAGDGNIILKFVFGLPPSSYVNLNYILS